MNNEFKMQSADMDGLGRKLIDIGLEFYEASIYIFLVRFGSNSVWHIAKNINLPRTTVYRYVNNLVEKGFLVERVEGKGKKYEAIIKGKFDSLIKNKQIELQRAQQESINLVTQLESLALQNSSNYKVLHYRGVDGLKQVTWNSTRAKDTFRIFEIDLLTSVIDEKFAEDMRIEFARMPIEFRQLTNKTIFSDYTKVTEHIQQWRVKYLPRDVLDIKIEIQVYNDVICMYDYKDKDVFIVEIYNQKLADMYKQMFDFYWGVARPMKIVSPFGAAILDL